MSTEREATMNSLVSMPGIPSLPRRTHSRGVEHHSARRAMTPRLVADNPQSPADAVDSVPAAPSQTDGTFTRNYFLQLLRREKRRADRTHSPLSVVVYRVRAESFLAFVRIVAETVRETDIVGHLADHSVAVLCPDTNDPGAYRLMEKIEAQTSHLPFSGETATYPDHHFNELTSGEWSPPEVHPLFIDEFKVPRRDGYWLKRLLDLVVASMALMLLSPVMLVAAMAVKFSSSGPMIFRQHRLGRGGIPFVFYKFRSMHTGNDDSIHRNYVQSLIKGEHDKVNQCSEGDPLYKIKQDPRVTRVGRFIRKYSIDELPQLFNVLKGDMSLVGPRPPLPYVAEKPGLTGLWQVEGRSKVSFDEMVRMDIRYIRNCCLSLDLRIMLKTFLVVFRRDGAV
jgi:lipopolysaccharide/colanic/teichoic acid biosynthesis glycosyltransferase